MNKSLLVGVITLAIATISARAGELAPMVGLEKNFRTGASALIYYTEGADGDRIVSTVQSDDTEMDEDISLHLYLGAGTDC